MIVKKHSSHSFFLHVTSFLVFLSLSCVNNAHPISFHFDNFKGQVVRSENYRGGQNLIALQRDASVDDLGVIDLTAPRRFGWPFYGAGRAVYSEPMRLWDNKTGEIANFTTEFSFVIDLLEFNTSTCGDGFTFIISHYPSVIPPGSCGETLGVTAESKKFDASGSESYIAVEFDTLQNGEWEPSSFHMGIDVNSIESVVDVDISSRFANLTVYKGKAKVSYDAITHELSAFLLNDDNKSSYNTPILSHVVDLREILPQIVSVGFSASTSHLYELHRIESWSFTSTLESINEMKPNHTSNHSTSASNDDKTNNDVAKGNNTIWFIVTIVLSCGMVVFFILVVLVWYIFSQRKKKEEDEFEGQNRPHTFPYVELERATGNFAEGKKLGKGGFGFVYEGFIDDGRSNLHVAIKRTSKDSSQGKKEYLSEVNIITRLSHRNLVKLHGWCHQEKEMLLVYEFLPNRSLDFHLFNPNRLLSWRLRHKILLGLASGLLYLHESCEKYVVHRDIKSSNVLLDESYEAKLGDFGLARLVEHEHSVKTTVVAGTRGYIAPECVYTGKFSKESDVYAFGIVALEIVCGKKCINDENTESTPVLLTQRVWEMYGKQKLMEVVDERLDGHFDNEQIERALIVGLWCCQPDLHKRPSIRQASAVLNFDIPMPKLPTNFPSISIDAIIRNMSSIPSSSSSSSKLFG